MMSLFVPMLTATLFPFLAAADGGVIRMQESQGPFTITIFSPAEVSRGRPSDITVMIQSSDSGKAVLDADVQLAFAPPVGAGFKSNDLVCGAGNGVPADLSGRTTAFVATHAHAANKLLYGASVVLPGAGTWQMRTTVQRGSETASVSCTLPVSTSPSRLAAVWPCLALPPVAIALFACNQRLVHRQRRNLSGQFTNQETL